MSSANEKADFRITNPKEGLKLTQNQINFMKLIEKENLVRVSKLKNTQKRNRWTGLALGCTVLGIYAYSILSIKQETFLDDFEMPKTVIEKK